jgi:AraC-like DNA-binding protein
MYILSISENLLTLLCGIGILQGVLFAGLIYFHPKSDRSVNIFLALYILITSAIMSLPLSIKLVGWQNGTLLVQIPLLSGPLLYLYLRSYKEKITWREALPHFIPALIYFFLTYWNLSRFWDKYPNTGELPPPEVLTNPVTIFITFSKPIQQIIYYFLSRNTLNAYQRSIRHLFSETSRIDLRWTRFLINGYLILVCVFIVLYPIMLRFPENFDLLLLINMCIATPYIYMATYKGVMQPSLWQVQSTISKETVQEELQQAEVLETITDKKQKPVNDEKISPLVQKITSLMEDQKLYQDPDLTLRQLATTLDAPVYQVSQALNEGMQKNFYDLINGYRVEEAQRLLLDPKNVSFTILSIGFEAGFNSKTTFNTVFKKFTGLTPTAYRDQHLELAV